MNIDVRSLPPKYQQQVLAKAIAQQGRKREPKYRNLKTERMVDGRRIVFDSRKEAQRYDQLKAMLQRGEIENLRLQQDFTLIEAYTSASGERVRAMRYRADFTYRRDGKDIVEDVKGMKTKEYRMKKKLMMERYGIEVREV